MNFDRIPDRVDLEHAVRLLAKVYSNFDTTPDHGVTHSVLQILNRCKLPKIKPVPVNQQSEAYRKEASKLHLQMWHLLQSGCNPLRRLTFRIDSIGLTSFGMEKQIQKEVIKILRVLKGIKRSMKKLKRTPWETCYIEESLKTIRTSLLRQLSRKALVWQDNLPIPIFGEPDYISDTTLLVESTDTRGATDARGGIDADQCACRAKLEKLNLTVMNCCPHLVRSSSRTALAFPEDSTSKFETVTQPTHREWPKGRDAGKSLMSASNLVHFKSRLAFRSSVRKVFRSARMSFSNVQSYISQSA